MSDAEREKTIDTLHSENCSCVIFNNGEMRILKERGVKDLYQTYWRDPDFLRGAFIADKTIGKAAAAIMIIGGVESVYTDTASLPAQVLLKRANITAEIKESVPYIKNRSQTDLCPLEKICQDEDSADKIAALIGHILRRSAMLK